MSLDGSALGVVQPDFGRPSFVIAGFTEEVPVAIPTLVKVFRFEPARAFVRVPSSCPLQQTGEDVAIHVSKYALAHHVPMIVRPATNLGVELIDQIGGRHAMCSFDGSSDAIQEGSDILLGRLDEQFSVRVSAHVLSEEIKAMLHVRNDCLRRREFKTSFLQELLTPPRDLRRFPAGYFSCKSHCFVKNAFFHIPGFQPLLENDSVHQDVSQQPIV